MTLRRLKTFSKGGVHPSQHKIGAAAPIVAVELPDTLVLPLAQHIGAPARPVVKKGDRVERGQMVAEAAGPVSAPIHSPVAGTVAKIDKTPDAQGRPADAIFITRDPQAPLPCPAFPSPAPPPGDDAPSPEAILQAIRSAGIVGLGGATFPAHVKLSPPPGMKADVLVVNGAECEPWLTNDDALMQAAAAEVADGVWLLARAAGVERAVIGVEANKPRAIEALRQAVEQSGTRAGGVAITVEALRTKYPQGGEKQLIKALTGREVPSGALPVAVGAIVQNVATAAAVSRAVRLGEPLMERVVSVTGPNVARPGNYRAAIGIPLRALAEAAGGVPADTGKIVLGGPMMGRTATNLDAPVTKGTSGLLMLPEADAARHAPEPCIRCARCVSVCPMGLEPYLLATLSRLGRFDDAEQAHIMDCIECGSCSYTCPSWRPILDYIRLGKGRVAEAIRARKARDNKPKQ